VLSLLADAFDTEQLLECMGQLKRAQPVNVPIYDFKKHQRCSESFRKVVITLCDLEFRFIDLLNNNGQALFILVSTGIL
jgi:hypothetical protein